LHRDYYDKRWSRQSEYLHPHARLRLDYIRRYVSSFRSTFSSDDASAQPRILDVGCGTGWLSRELRPFGQVTGLEPSTEGIRKAEATNSGDHDLEFVVGTAETLLLAGRSGEFDLVVASEVIEHVIDQSGFLDDIYSLLKPRGLLILTTPRQELRNDWEAAGAEKQPIENWLTRDRLLHLTRTVGFECLKYDVGFVEFTRKGIYRWLLSERVMLTSRRAGLSFVLDWLRRRHALYQFLLARKTNEERPA
jgi:2-polyprenyl-3-methyl-5-hydroxy-6-metoxy-1,4-benzoquinol methylase